MWQIKICNHYDLFLWDFPVSFLLSTGSHPKPRDNVLQPDRAEPLHPVHGETAGPEWGPEEQNHPDHFHHK